MLSLSPCRARVAPLRGARARPRASAIFLAAAVVSGTPARIGAEEPTVPTPSATEEMVVVGERRTGIDVLAGATTTRIEADERLLEGARIDDLLSEVPGVQVRRFGGVGEQFEISIRGSSPQQVPVFLDGVRIESALSNRSDLSTLCLDVLDEVQVTRGAGAARAGTGAIGGVVNLVSRVATERPETRVRLSGGNFETVEGSLRHSRRSGPWAVSVGYCGFHTEGDFEFQRARNSLAGGSSPVLRRDNNEAERHSALAQVEREVGLGRIRLTHLAGHLDRGAPGLESEQTMRRFAQDEHLSLLSIARFDVPLGNALGGEFEATLAHRYEANHFEDPEVFPGNTDPIDTRTRVHSLTPRLSTTLPFTTLGGTFEAGLLVEGRFDQRATNEANSKSRSGASARVELTTRWLDDRLRISPTLRFERFEGLDSEWIPGIFFEADPLPWLRLKASASRSYRAPSFGELYLPDKGFERGNEALEAERAWNFEVGGRFDSPFEAPWLDGDVEFTWFAGEVDNAIVFQLISPNTFAFVNSGRSQTRGHELTVRWHPHDWIRLSGARTVTRARLESTGRNVGGIAVSQIDGRLALGPADRFKIVVEAHYTGRIPLNSGGTVQLSSRTVFDASASLDLARIEALGLDDIVRSLWLSLRARNLGNAAVRDVRSRPRPGRNFAVAIEGIF